MKFHIVMMNETIDDILFLYAIKKDELIEANQHIRKWNQLIPGTKLKIPTITETIDDDIMEMEPFIEDYYPRITMQNKEDEKFQSEQINSLENNEIVNLNEEESEIKTEDELKEINITNEKLSSTISDNLENRMEEPIRKEDKNNLRNSYQQTPLIRYYNPYRYYPTYPIYYRPIYPIYPIYYYNSMKYKK